MNCCDHCGSDLIDDQPFNIEALPFNIASANIGESGVVCSTCVLNRLKQTIEERNELNILIDAVLREATVAFAKGHSTSGYWDAVDKVRRFQDKLS